MAAGHMVSLWASDTGLSRVQCRPIGGVDDEALAAYARDCGCKLEQAMAEGDRVQALAWQAAMFDAVRLRRAKRFGSDIQAAGGAV